MSKVWYTYTLTLSDRRERVVISDEDAEQLIRKHPRGILLLDRIVETDEAPTHRLITFGLAVTPLSDIVVLLM